jgi:hypothetical protein
MSVQTDTSATGSGCPLECLHADLVLDIVYEFNQWFIPRICHANGKPDSFNTCVYHH